MSEQINVARAIPLDELRTMQSEQILWITYRFEHVVTDVVFWTGFGTYEDKIDGTLETITYVNTGFDFVEDYGKDVILWTDRPTEKQVKEYKWKTDI